MDAEGESLQRGLATAYAPLIRKELLALAWMPIGCDTPGVVASMHGAAFTFSGGALLTFGDAPDLFLTWSLRFPYRLQATIEGLAWRAHSLDRVYATRESPWDQVEGGRLLTVEFFTGPGACGGVIGLRHRIETSKGETFLWIATGYDEGVREGDDLWVSVGSDPANLGDLAPVMMLGA